MHSKRLMGNESQCENLKQFIVWLVVSECCGKTWRQRLKAPLWASAGRWPPPSLCHWRPGLSDPLQLLLLLLMCCHSRSTPWRLWPWVDLPSWSRGGPRSAPSFAPLKSVAGSSAAASASHCPLWALSGCHAKAADRSSWPCHLCQPWAATAGPAVHTWWSGRSGPRPWVFPRCCSSDHWPSGCSETSPRCQSIYCCCCFLFRCRRSH